MEIIALKKPRIGGFSFLEKIVVWIKCKSLRLEIFTCNLHHLLKSKNFRL